MSVATALARSRVRSTNTTSRAAPRRTTANAHADPTAPVPIIPTFITSALPPPAHRRDRNHRYRSCPTLALTCGSYAGARFHRACPILLTSLQHCEMHVRWCDGIAGAAVAFLGRLRCMAGCGGGSRRPDQALPSEGHAALIGGRDENGSNTMPRRGHRQLRPEVSPYPSPRFRQRSVGRAGPARLGGAARLLAGLAAGGGRRLRRLGASRGRLVHFAFAIGVGVEPVGRRAGAVEQAGGDRARQGGGSGSGRDHHRGLGRGRPAGGLRLRGAARNAARGQRRKRQRQKSRSCHVILRTRCDAAAVAAANLAQRNAVAQGRHGTERRALTGVNAAASSTPGRSAKETYAACGSTVPAATAYVENRAAHPIAAAPRKIEAGICDPLRAAEARRAEPRLLRHLLVRQLSPTDG